MKLLLFLLLPAATCYAGPNIKDIPWPKRVREFPAGEHVSFSSGSYEVRHRIPEGSAIQSVGGSGGPIVEVALRDRKSGWHTSFQTQSVGERLLVSWHGKPQIEVWGRIGGGGWTRELYRFINGRYRSVRIDEFEHVPRHHNQKAPTATLPDEFHGKAPPDGDPTLYFVETRLPST